MGSGLCVFKEYLEAHAHKTLIFEGTFERVCHTHPREKVDGLWREKVTDADRLWEQSINTTAPKIVRFINTGSGGCMSEFRTNVPAILGSMNAVSVRIDGDNAHIDLVPVEQKKGDVGMRRESAEQIMCAPI